MLSQQLIKEHNVDQSLVNRLMEMLKKEQNAVDNVAEARDLAMNITYDIVHCSALSDMKYEQIKQDLNAKRRSVPKAEAVMPDILKDVLVVIQENMKNQAAAAGISAYIPNIFTRKQPPTTAGAAADNNTTAEGETPKGETPNRTFFQRMMGWNKGGRRTQRRNHYRSPRPLHRNQRVHRSHARRGRAHRPRRTRRRVYY